MAEAVIVASRSRKRGVLSSTLAHPHIDTSQDQHTRRCSQTTRSCEREDHTWLAASRLCRIRRRVRCSAWPCNRAAAPMRKQDVEVDLQRTADISTRSSGQSVAIFGQVQIRRRRDRQCRPGARWTALGRCAYHSGGEHVFKHLQGIRKHCQSAPSIASGKWAPSPAPMDKCTL